jgi:hypothetical protein
LRVVEVEEELKRCEKLKNKMRNQAKGNEKE